MKPTRNGPNPKSVEHRHGVLGRLLLVVCVALAWTGCKQEAKDTKPVADTNPAGTYALVSVDGKQVPCTITHEGRSPTIKSGSFVINPDGSCSSKIAFAMPGGGDSGREVKATYTREGSVLTMKWEGAGITTGSIEGGTFTMTNEGMVLVYRK